MRALFPLKRPGTYVAGETVWIVARFTAAVAVSGDYAPRLALNAADDAFPSPVSTLTLHPKDGRFRERFGSQMIFEQR